MENSLFGVVIQVSNLDLCRAFYRDVLGLGAPVMDSSFWVEFRLDSQSSLFLEKSEVLDTSRNGGRLMGMSRRKFRRTRSGLRFTVCMIPKETRFSLPRKRNPTTNKETES